MKNSTGTWTNPSVAWEHHQKNSMTPQFFLSWCNAACFFFVDGMSRISSFGLPLSLALRWFKLWCIWCIFGGSSNLENWVITLVIGGNLIYASTRQLPKKYAEHIKWFPICHMGLPAIPVPKDQRQEFHPANPPGHAGGLTNPPLHGALWTKVYYLTNPSLQNTSQVSVAQKTVNPTFYSSEPTIQLGFKIHLLSEMHHQIWYHLFLDVFLPLYQWIGLRRKPVTIS